MSLITINEAKDMISLYKKMRTEILKEDFSTDMLPLNITLPAAEVQSLISQSGCEKVRVYLGMQETDDLVDVILVGVDDDDKDIIPTEDYILINHGQRCPSICPPASSINP